MLKFIFVLIVLSCFNLKGFSQATTLGVNTLYIGQTILNKKWNVWHELQHRENSFTEANRTSFVRIALQRELPNNFQIGQGYVFFVRQSLEDLDAEVSTDYEHRIYQQLFHKNNYKKFIFSHRYRVEERFYSAEFHVRFRYMLQTNYIINKNTLEKDAFYIGGYKELFLNVDSGDIFDRARFYAGAGYVFGEQLRLEVGNMFQYSESQSVNYMMIGVFHKISPSGRKKVSDPIGMYPV